MVALLAGLVFQNESLYALDNHFLHRQINNKNFDFQTTPYMKSQFKYFQTDKEAAAAGLIVLRKMSKLTDKSNMADVRSVIDLAYLTKERCLPFQYREEFSNFFNNYFSSNPAQAKNLSRQDVCALLAIDIGLSRTHYSSGLKPLLTGFRRLIKKDFECLDVSIGFLRLASVGVIPNEPWIHEREEWALQVAGRADAMGIVSAGVRAYRHTAYGIRLKKLNEVDTGIRILQKASTLVGRSEDVKYLAGNIKYLKDQRLLLSKQLK